MRIIRPAEISGTIMSLFEEATERVVVVSPYYNFSNWKKFNSILQRTINRNVRLEFYVRKDEPASIRQVKNLGFVPIEIERLHAKLYFNEKEAVISSMNLNQSSDESSLDIGLVTETEQEYTDVIKFFERFIAPRGQKPENFQPEDWINHLAVDLQRVFGREPFLTMEGGFLEIRGNDVYQAFIEREESRMLRINCVISMKEFDYFNRHKGILANEYMSTMLQKAEGGHYSYIWGIVDNIKSESLEYQIGDETDLIKNVIVTFVKNVEDVKTLVRSQSKVGF
jgi:hypothetical protein